MSTEGDVVLITGTTSGIGKATAELLAAKGCRVFGTSRNPAGKSTQGYEFSTSTCPPTNRWRREWPRSQNGPAAGSTR